MKTIGVIGGMSWESTLTCYRLLNEGVKQRRGGHHSAKVVLESVDFADIEALQRAGDWAAAGALLAASARRLEGAGAQLLLLATNTMHLVADVIAGAVSIPFLHIVDVTAAAVRAHGVTRVGLLGTRFTMEGAFYVDRLRARGLDVVVPEADDRALVHRVIYEELTQGRVLPASRAAYVAVVERLAAAGAGGVILGCTEIAMLIGPSDVALPVFDTTALQAEAAVELALATQDG